MLPVGTMRSTLTNALAPGILILTGIPGAGKTATAGALATRLGETAHVSGELLQRFAVVAAEARGDDCEAESERQLQLRERNVGLLASSFLMLGLYR